MEGEIPNELPPGPISVPPPMFDPNQQTGTGLLPLPTVGNGLMRPPIIPNFPPPSLLGAPPVAAGILSNPTTAAVAPPLLPPGWLNLKIKRIDVNVGGWMGALFVVFIIVSSNLTMATLLCPLERHFTTVFPVVTACRNSPCQQYGNFEADLSFLVSSIKNYRFSHKESSFPLMFPLLMVVTSLVASLAFTSECA